jgi:predicted RND superfamily exporter protein
VLKLKIFNPHSRLGFRIASYPWTTICVTLIGFLLTILGFINFTFKGQYLDILIPPNFKFANDTKWFLDSFDEVVRHETIIIKADNVLLPSVLEKVSYKT